jgi:coenzyme F420-reducing hydrogenase delta subunit
MASRSDLLAVGLTARLLGRLDAAVNRLYGSRYNPLYRSGAVTVALIVLLLVTGLYLLLYYRVGTPYESVARITGQVWFGRWIRSLHRFAADAAVVTALIHAVRMFAQRRSWGARAMPWIAGVALVALLMVCGWTGYVMVWDTFGQVLAVEGARLLDLVPLFSEPLGRAFVGERPIPGAFFFLNLFLHIALPIGMGVVLMLHVSRVARATLFPAKAMMWWGTGLLTLLSVALPVAMAPEADPLRLPTSVPVDVFYAFWLPAARAVPAVWMAAASVGFTVFLLLIPRLTRPAPERALLPSVVNERLCTGCEQCAQDCPYEAIAMVARSDHRDTLVARVDPARCVSCGICAGSCAPMGVGPPGRTGRDQLAMARNFMMRESPGPADVVIIGCKRGGGGVAAGDHFDGAPVCGVSCAGSIHSSVIELLIRGGAGGVLVLACPKEDCWNREGPTWLEQRLYHEREAELQARVDRRRVLVANIALSETPRARELLASFRARITALEAPEQEGEIDLLRLCDTVTGEVVA